MNFPQVPVSTILFFASTLFMVYKYISIRSSSKITLGKTQGIINTQSILITKMSKEKEWLLTEIHHRVKNNLQTVISLLHSQSSYLENPDAVNALRKSQNRMHAISLIHKKLYRFDHLSEIDMDLYIHELVNNIADCFDVGEKIKFAITSQSVNLDIVQAVPVGLILNEAISNSIKYAFPKVSNGNIFISFRLTYNGLFELHIADNGVGLPAEFDAGNVRSLGMNLINGLTSQLGGQIEISNNPGLSMVIIFKSNSSFTESKVIMN